MGTVSEFASNFMFEYSLRFFPFWNRFDPYQTIGLISMIDYIFSLDPKANTWVELGSFYGESSTIMLGFRKLKKLYCVDSWTVCPEYNAAHKTFDESTKSADFSPAKDVFLNRLKKEIDSGRCVPMIQDSVSASLSFDDNTLDVVYVDADHSYESVMTDLETWYKKIKTGGFLCGHDYKMSNDSWPGVTKAVDTFVTKYSLNQPIRFKDSSYIIRKK